MLSLWVAILWSQLVFFALPLMKTQNVFLDGILDVYLTLNRYVWYLALIMTVLSRWAINDYPFASLRFWELLMTPSLSAFGAALSDEDLPQLLDRFVPEGLFDHVLSLDLGLAGPITKVLFFPLDQTFDASVMIFDNLRRLL